MLSKLLDWLLAPASEDYDVQVHSSMTGVYFTRHVNKSKKRADEIVGEYAADGRIARAVPSRLTTAERESLSI